MEGWVGGDLTRFPRPISSWRSTAIVWMAPYPGRPIRSTLQHSFLCLWVARTFQVAGSPVADSTPPLRPPDRCAACLDLTRAQSARVSRHLVHTGGLLPAGPEGVSLV